MAGCGTNNCLSSCDTSTKYADRIFDWFHGGRDPKAEKTQSFIDPNTHGEQSLNPKWINSSQASELEDKVCWRRMFVPAKLSVIHAIKSLQVGAYRSSQDSANIGYDCDDSIMACPKIKTK